MNKLNYFKALILSALLLSVLGCASAANREGTGEYFDDTVITSEVKSSIFSEASLKSSEIPDLYSIAEGFGIVPQPYRQRLL